jgi:hypothetical protein
LCTGYKSKKIFGVKAREVVIVEKVLKVVNVGGV